MTVETVQSFEAAETAECTCMPDTPMSVPEAAKLLRCSPEYLYAGLRQGRFPGAQVGRTWKMPRTFLHSFVRDVLNVGRSMSFEDYAADWRARNLAEVAV